MTTPAQRETLAFALDVQAEMQTLDVELQRIYAVLAGAVKPVTVATFLPVFNEAATAALSHSLAQVTIATAAHAQRLVGRDLDVPSPEAENAARASVEMYEVLLARYDGGLRVDAIRSQLLGMQEDVYAERLVTDVQGNLPEGAQSLYSAVLPAYVSEGKNAVNVQSSVVKFNMLAAPDA